MPEYRICRFAHKDAASFGSNQRIVILIMNAIVIVSTSLSAKNNIESSTQTHLPLTLKWSAPHLSRDTEIVVPICISCCTLGTVDVDWSSHFRGCSGQKSSWNCKSTGVPRIPCVQGKMRLYMHGVTEDDACLLEALFVTSTTENLIHLSHV